MLDQMFSGHLSNLNRALTRTTQRQSMLMTNVANVNVPGYKRQDLDFNILLDEAQQETRDRMADRRATRSSLRNDGNNVDMEREVFSIAETDLRYQALTDMTTRFFSGLRNVIREGR